MLSAMLLLISIAALTQFALYYWRAILASAAAQPVSDRVLAAAGLNDSVTAGDFATLATIHELTPDLRSGSHGLGLVRLYYRAMDGLRTLATKHLPSLAAWSERECAVCARYAAVQVDLRLQANLALVASMQNS